MSERYVIKNFDDFIETTRVLVFNSFGSKAQENDNRSYEDLTVEEKSEIDDILSHNECSIIAKAIAKKQINKRTNKIRYTISDNTFVDMVNSFNERMVSNILRGLVNKGLVETAYDNESNDFIFYVPDSLKKNEKPETD